MSTLTAYNFQGNLSRKPNGALNSGQSIDVTTWGFNNFAVPGAIMFTDKEVDITGVIQGAIIMGQSRIENGIMYVYSVDHLSNLYKIQVNDPSTKNPAYDTGVLITTLTTATSFTMGGSLILTTNGMLIGHDSGVSYINFDGSGEQFIGDPTQWQTNVPRQGRIYKGIVYYTNGTIINAIGQNLTLQPISSSLSVSSDQVFKTVEISGDGQNLIFVSSNIPNLSLLSSSPNLNSTYAGISYVYRWNPTSQTFVNITSTSGFDHTAALTVGSKELIWGYNLTGGGLISLSDGFETLTSGTGKFLVSQAPTANGVGSSGNLVGWMTVEPQPTTATLGPLTASLFLYGNLDQDENTTIYTREINVQSALASGDILRVPWLLTIGNFQNAGNTSGYGTGITTNVIGLGRIYFSTVEWNGVAFKYRLMYFCPVSTLTNPCTGVYETQAIIAGSTDLPTATSITPTNYTVYYENATGGEEFTIDLIGIDGNPLASGTKIFSALATSGVIPISVNSTNASSGPISVSSTPVLGIRVTNSGVFTPFIHKIDVTY